MLGALTMLCQFQLFVKGTPVACLQRDVCKSFVMPTCVCKSSYGVQLSPMAKGSWISVCVK